MKEMSRERTSDRPEARGGGDKEGGGTFRRTRRRGWLDRLSVDAVALTLVGDAGALEDDAAIA